MLGRKYMKKIVFILCILSLMMVTGQAFATYVPSLTSVEIESSGVVGPKGFPDCNVEDLEAKHTGVNDNDGDPVKLIHNWKSDGGTITPLIVPFERVNGTDTYNAPDYSGNDNDGTIYNASWQSTAGYDDGGTYYYNGWSSWISFGDDSTILLGDGSFSVTLWVKTTSGSSNWLNIMKSMPDAVTWWRIIYKPSTNKLRFTTDDSSVKRIAEATVDLDDGDWHHIAAVKTAGVGHRVYVDGSYEAFSGDNDDVSNDGPVTLGKPYNTSYWYGYIDDVRMWDRALSWQQVAEQADDISDEDETKFILSEETFLKDEWSVTVTPNDNNDGDGTPKTSSTITIGFCLQTCHGSGWVYGTTYYLVNDIVNDVDTCMFIDNDYVILDCLDYAIDGDDYGMFDNGVRFDYADHGTVKNCDINGFFDNVLINYSNYVTVQDNDIHNDDMPGKNSGVYIRYSDNAEINNNYVYENFVGIGSSMSKDAVILSNLVDRSDASGIALSTSEGFECFRNEVRQGTVGVSLSGNSIQGDSVDNIFYENVLHTNSLWDVNTDTYTEDNLFYRNDFLDAGDNVYSDHKNQFNTTGFGNYWEGHNCIDTEEPYGICDNAYTTDGPNPYGTDSYPLADEYN
jgi:hypothetical protein